MKLDFEKAVTLLRKWEHFDPEGTRVQKILRAVADYPSNQDFLREAEALIRALPEKMRQRLGQLAPIEV